MKVLYVSARRAKERPLLSTIKELVFKEVGLHLRSTGIGYFRKLLEFFEHVRKFRPDILLFEAAGLYALLPAFVGRLYGIPLVIRFKGDIWTEYAERKYAISIFEKTVKKLNFMASSWMLEHARAILPIADHLRPVIERNLNSRKEMFTVPIAFDTLNVRAATNECHLTENDFVLTITNFNYWEKVKPLARAVADAAPLLRARGICWIILGEGFFLERFRLHISEHIESEVVLLEGWQNPYPFYKRAKALFYVSGLDGLPNVLLEAASLNVPIIMNHDCPAVELIADGHSGIVVDFSDHAWMESVIDKLVADEGYFITLAENAHAFVCKNYRAAKVGEELKEALVGCLK